MGWNSVSLYISAAVSRHNSPQDKIDDDLWEDLVDQVRAIVESPKYRQISAMLS